MDFDKVKMHLLTRRRQKRAEVVSAGRATDVMFNTAYGQGYPQKIGCCNKIQARTVAF